MALIEITPDLSRTAKALERIADALERISPVISPPSSQSNLDDLGNFEYDKPLDGEDWESYAPRRNYQ